MALVLRTYRWRSQASYIPCRFHRITDFSQRCTFSSQGIPYPNNSQSAPNRPGADWPKGTSCPPESVLWWLLISLIAKNNASILCYERVIRTVALDASDFLRTFKNIYLEFSEIFLESDIHYFQGKVSKSISELMTACDWQRSLGIIVEQKRILYVNDFILWRVLDQFWSIPFRKPEVPGQFIPIR